jgi:hypothetical protein
VESAVALGVDVDGAPFKPLTIQQDTERLLKYLFSLTNGKYCPMSGAIASDSVPDMNQTHDYGSST